MVRNAADRLLIFSARKRPLSCSYWMQSASHSEGFGWGRGAGGVLLFSLLPLFGLWVKTCLLKIANNLFEGWVITEEDDGFSALRNYFLQ